MADATTTRTTLAAVGLVVADLERSTDFYTRVLGMATMQTFTLDGLDEVVVGYPGGRGAAIVLMHYTDDADHTYTDIGGKVVFYVEDPKATADAIRAEGLEITREPEAVPGQGSVLVGFAKDPDGYTLELLQLAPRRER